jgi:hypothetical protein
MYETCTDIYRYDDRIQHLAVFLILENQTLVNIADEILAFNLLLMWIQNFHTYTILPTILKIRIFPRSK